MTTMSSVAEPGGLPNEPAAARATAAIRSLNDAFRRTFRGGAVLETLGIVNLRDADRIAVLLAVQRFTGFKPGNAPYDEHDFGVVEVGQHRCYWKIDTYDLSMLGHSPDAADPSITARVLTVMLADEY
ncbi:DUF3768 domain-containing protein [Methylobacterium sp. E-045]|uniref:DUF3768 domain-containing protein n=1 Tax=Methylobacterium sp. E-045 TaxID=2836575 RepID=UPI001FB92343|nr:DUF3768 domain-containing protein [Methylobacterium sp. E-045]MCJ2127577.1 DUF3768 domain-containing protein [Methylobacterium sp. E-045]